MVFRGIENSSNQSDVLAAYCTTRKTSPTKSSAKRNGRLSGDFGPCPRAGSGVKARTLRCSRSQSLLSDSRSACLGLRARLSDSRGLQDPAIPALDGDAVQGPEGSGSPTPPNAALCRPRCTFLNLLIAPGKGCQSFRNREKVNEPECSLSLSWDRETCWASGRMA
jgi:hypothetical protein